jgi:hypothetical protein
MPETRSTTIRFSEEVYRRLEASSVLTGLPINSIVVVACLEWLERHGPERLTTPLPANLETFQRIRPGSMRRGLPAGWLPGRSRQTGPQPFDLLSEMARRAMELAQRDAQERQDGYIGTQHLLEGLMQVEDGNAARVLSALGVGAEALRRRLEEVVRPEQPAAGSGPLQPTRRLKKVVEIGFEEARTQASAYVGTEHLLLGILIEGEGVAAHALRESGVNGETVREELGRLLVDEGSGEAP